MVALEAAAEEAQRVAELRRVEHLELERAAGEVAGDPLEVVGADAQQRAPVGGLDRPDRPGIASAADGRGRRAGSISACHG